MPISRFLLQAYPKQSQYLGPAVFGAMFCCGDIIPSTADIGSSKASQQTRCSFWAKFVMKWCCHQCWQRLFSFFFFFLNTVQSNESGYGVAKFHYTVTQGASPCPCCAYRNVQSSKYLVCDCIFYFSSKHCAVKTYLSCHVEGLCVKIS